MYSLLHAALVGDFPQFVRTIRVAFEYSIFSVKLRVNTSLPACMYTSMKNEKNIETANESIFLLTKQSDLICTEVREEK